MKKPTRSLSISKPCNERWDNMIQMHNGKYCHSCNLVVMDFSRMSDKDILSYFKNYQGKTCGKFRSDQLNRELHHASVGLPLPIRNAAATVLVSALATGTATAQELLPPKHNPEIHYAQSAKSETKPKHPSTNSHVIAGRVVEEGSGDRLIGANVVLNGHEIGTVTDFDGNFSLRIPPEITGEIKLTFSYVGYQNSEIVVRTDSRTPITMQMIKGALLGEVVIVGSTVETEMMGGISMGVRQKDSTRTDTLANALPEPEMQISPNPFRQSFRIDLLNMKKGSYKLHLYDMSGKEIWVATRKLEEGANTFVVSIPTELINGSYILHVNSKFGQLNSIIARQEE